MTESGIAKLRSIELTRTRQWLLGIVGAVVMAAGAVAVFLTTNGVGAGVLIAVGFVILYTAIVGVVPRNLKAGQAEMSFYEEVLAEASPEAAESLARKIVRSAAAPAEVVRTAADFLAFDSVALEFIERSVPPGAELALAPAARIDNRRIDALVKRADVQLVIEIKWFPSLVARHFDIAPVIERLQSYRTDLTTCSFCPMLRLDVCHQDS